MSKKKNTVPPPDAKKPVLSSSHTALARLLMIVCGVFAFALYLNTLTAEFTVDDDTVILKNKLTKEGVNGVFEILTSSYRAGFYDRNENLYRPLSVLLFAVEWQLVKGNPLFFHFVSVLLYAITAVILFVFLRKLLKGMNLILPFLIAMLFIAHPVHTEAVANVKSNDELLGFLLSILTLLFVLRFMEARVIRNLLLVAFCYLLALLSKETAVTIIVAAPLMLYFFSLPKRNEWIAVSVSLIIPLVIYFSIRALVLKDATYFSSVELINNSLVAGDWLSREATAILLLGKYIFLLVFPYTLSYDYSYNTILLHSFSDAETWFSLLIILGLGIIAFRGLKKKNPIAFGILFFAITIAIVSNVFILIESTFAERFLYMPSLGFCIAIVFAVSKIFKAEKNGMAYNGIRDLLAKNRGMIILFTIVLIIFSARTYSRNLDWKNNYTLLQHDVRVNPNSARIRFALGSTLLFEKAENEKDDKRKKEWVQKAIQELDIATSILPEYGEGWFHLGFAYNDAEKFKSAVAAFENGFAHTSKTKADQFLGAGIAYGETKDYKKSFAMFDSVMIRNDTSFDAYNNLGMFQSRIKMYDSAITNLHKAIEIKPETIEAYYNLGNTYAYMQNYNEAIKWYEKALEIDPQFEIALENLGNSYAALMEYDKALKIFQKILTSDPSNPQARYNAGITYRMLGDSARAKEFLNSH